MKNLYAFTNEAGKPVGIASKTENKKFSAVKKAFLLFLAITLFLTGNLFAQKTVSSTYVFSYGTGTYGGDLGLSYTTVIGANQDNATSGLRTLPFTFNYLGQTYTQWSVTSNGLITLGSTPLTGNETSNSMAASIPGIKIAPYWDDLTTGTGGYVKYGYYNGTMYINFRLAIPKSGGVANADFQVRLTASGGISFYYGSTATPWPSFQSIGTNTGGYSIGIGNSATDFASVTMTSATTATCAFGTAKNNNTQSITGPFDIYFTPDNTLPTISAETIANIQGTGNRTLTKTIGDGTTGKGIPTSGSYVPRIYYKKNVGGTYVSTQGQYVSSGMGTNTNWNFTVDHALLGGVAQGDVIYYYVAAQDEAYNVASNPTGVVATDVNTITTPPASPSSYVIPLDFSGTVTVGSGGDYPSLTNSGGLFEQLNAGSVTGDVTVNILSDLTSETGTIPLNAWTNGPGGPFTVTLNPIGARTISGTSGLTGLIYLNGANNFIIDGLNTGGNSLTISNTSTSNPAVNFEYGANHNTVTNTTLTANGGAVVKFGAASSGKVNYNNTVSNSIITSGTSIPSNGVSFVGSTSYDSYDNTIDNNKIINFTASGVTASNGYINTTISNNEIYNAIPSGTSLNGITLGTYYGAGIYIVFNNYIHDLNPASSTSMGTVNGIYYGQSSYEAPYDILNIHNNVISLDATSSNTNITLNGMWFTGGNGNYTPQVYIYYNTIYIGGTGIAAGTSTGLKIGGGNYLSKHTIKNNAIYNARSGGTGKHYGVGYYYSNYIVSNNNDIYVSPGGVFGRYVATDYANLAAWKTATSQDANSISANPAFTSATDYLPTNAALAAGTPIPEITTDILGVTRNATSPTMGAYEIPCVNPINGGTIAADQTSDCTPYYPEPITSTGLPVSTGTMEYKWQSSVSPFTDWTDINSNTESYDPDIIAETTKYKRLARISCKTDWVGAAESNVVTVTVSQTPAANAGTVVAGASSGCIGATSTFTVTGAELSGGTGAWSSSNPAIATVNANSGLVTAVSPGTVDIIYTVTGGCGGDVSASQPFTVNPDPTLGSVTVSDASVCHGNPVTFYANGLIDGLSEFTYTLKVNGINVPQPIATQEVIGGTASFTVPNPNPGVYNVEILSITVDGCISNFIGKKASFAVTPVPTLSSITEDQPEVCLGSPISFTANGLMNGLTTFEYTISVNNGTPSTASETISVTDGTATFSFTPGVGEYEIVLTSAIVNGCQTNFTTTNVANFTVAPDPTISITGETAVCAGDEATLTATPANGTGTKTIQWQYLVGANWMDLSGENAATLTVSPAATTDYRATYSATGNACNLATSNVQTITVNELPIANAISGNSAICLEGSLTLTSHATGTGTLTYTWASSNETVATVLDGVVTPVSAGTTNITYTVTDGSATACKATSDPFEVTVISLPATPGIDVVNNCDGTATLTATGITGSSVLWSTNENTASITVDANGTYTVTQSDLGCTSHEGSAVVTLWVHTGTEWYVSTSGSDTNIGTASCPFATIQQAITTAAAGDIIYVGSGTYNENLVINKSLTLNGANAQAACVSRSSESKIAPSSGLPLSITADGVTIDGFEITSPSYQNAIVCGGTSDLTLVYNNIHDIGTSVSGANVHSIIYTVANSSSTENVTISDNCFNNISSSSLTGFSSSAIGILQSTSTGVLTNLNIERNSINNVNVNTGIWPTGKLAYGIQLNTGSSNYTNTTGKIVGASIKNNTISNLTGFIATGIGLEGNTENAMVEGNTISNLTGYKLANRIGGGYDINGLKFETNRYVGTVTVQNNSIDASTFKFGTTSNLGYAVANYVPVANGGIANLGCNWYGTANYSELVAEYTAFTGKIFNKEGASTEFVSYSTDATTINCLGVNATPVNLTVSYNEASENVVVNFDVAGNSSVIYPIPGLTDQNLIAAKYVALQSAIAGGNAATIKAAALEIGDDIITEYYYMNGATKVYLQTAGSNPLVKNKYWDEYLNNSSTSTRYPSFTVNRFVVPTGSYSTSTNPNTGGAVDQGWLAPVYGKDLYVTVTLIHNGEVSAATQSYFIPAAPVVNITKGLGFLTIQSAISNNATTAGDIIEVSPGTYAELVTINKSIHLRSKTGETDNTFIMPSASLPVASDPLSNIITVIGSGVNAEISGFTVKGPGLTSCGSIGRGIFVHDGATANIHDNKILDIRDNATPLSGCQNGIAIQIGRNALGTSGTATIANNIITGYQKGAIVVDNTGSSAIISGNTITGIGTTAITAQNGIQISRGATATISNNTVSGNSYNASTVWDWGACGILLYQSGAVALTGGNTLSDNDNNYYAYGGITGTLALGAEIFGPSTAPVTKGYQILVDENINIDASLCTFEGISSASATLTQLFAIEDRIWHSVDDPSKTGFVKVKEGNVYVTPTETDAHIQNGIDAASSAWTVNIASGDYGRETASNRFIDGSGPYQFGLFIDKENLKIQGYTATNTLPTLASEASVEFTTAATNNFGYSGVYVLANGVTLNGLKVGDNYNISNVIDNNKTIEVTGENFTIERCWINTEADGGALYMGIRNITNPMSAFTINENRFENALVSINNGVGIGGVPADRKITNNEFSGVITPYIIGFRGWNGTNPAQGWIANPVGGAVVTGNTFSNTGVVNYIVARGNAGGYVNSELNWNEIWTSNTFGNHVVTLTDESTFDVRSYDDGSYPETRRISPLIQENVSIGQSGDVVLVSSGTFIEDVLVSTPVKLIGAGCSNTTISGPIGGQGSAIRIATAGATIDGFSITREGNNLTEWNNPDLNSAGIAIQSQGNFAEIRNCCIFGNRTGIDVNNSNGNNIHNNLIDNNHTGLIFRNQTDNTTVINNFVTNNRTAGILFLDASSGSNVPVQQALNSTFNNNNISGNWYGDIVDRQSRVSLPLPGTTNLKNFECNWFGTTAPVVSTANSVEPGYADLIPVVYGGTDVPPGGQPNILGSASANLDYVSYLTIGSDNDGSSFGFQPSPGACGGIPVEIVSVVSDHITCGETEGSVLVTWSGGAANYDLSWTDGSVTGITGNTYTITGLGLGSVSISVNEANGTSDATVAEILYLPVANVSDGLYFATIQGAIDATTTNHGDVIEVCSGTYDYTSEGNPVPSGLIKVTKGVTIKAAAGTRPIIDGSGFDGVFKIHPSALLPENTLIIEGFEIIGNAATGIAMTMQGCFDVTPAHVIVRDNWFQGMVGGIDFWGAGGYLPTGWTSALANIEITGNKFYDMVISGTDQGFGIMIEDPANWITAGNDYAVKIENNEFSNLPSNGANPGVGIVIPRANDTWEAANFYIAGNSFTSTVPVGVAIMDGDVSTALVENNSFDNNSVYAILATGIDNGPVTATCNWWGDPNTISIPVSGNVTYIPFLTNGTDNEPGTIGFQPVPGSCSQTEYFVNDNDQTGDFFTAEVGNDANFGTADAPFLTIQHAIDVVPEGATIKVDAGTYEEQVQIAKSLNIIGAGKTLTFVVAPDAGLLTSVTWNTAHPVIYAEGVGNTVNISDLAISGDGGRTVNWFIGALYYDASGTFNNNSITQIHNAGGFTGSQMGHAFYALQSGTATQTLAVTNNIIDAYQKGGIYIRSAGTTATVSNNIVTGQNVPLVIAQNGICFLSGSTGTIENNTVTNNIWNKVEHPHEYTAAGILLYQATATVGNNTLSGNELALSAYQATGSAYNVNTFSNNKIHVWLDAAADVNAGNVYDKYVLNSNLPEAVFGCIQYAVDEASSLDALTASAHHFEEQVTVDELNISLTGAGNTQTFIDAPVNMNPLFNPSSYDAYPVIGVLNSANLVLSDLTVDGKGRGNTNYKMMGVAFRNSGGEVSDCKILNIENTPFNGTQHGVGIYAYNDDDVSRNITIKDNEIVNFQKNALALNAGATTPMVIDVSGNTITGKGATAITAQNGIQTQGELLTGSISGNTISGIAYDNTAASTKWVASSILNYYSGIDIKSNIITGAHMGIYNYDASGTIADNNLTIEKVGVYAFGILGTDPPKAVPQPFEGSEKTNETSLKSASITSVTGLTVEINNNTVSFTGTDNTATYGIEVDAGWGPQDLSVSGTGNIVSGFEVGFEVYRCESDCDAGMFTSVSFNNNTILNNTIGIRSNVGYLTVDGECNWFGTTSAGSVTAQVLGDVDFTPWLTSDGGACDVEAPILNVTGFTANGDAMGGDLENGYILNLDCSDAGDDQLVQFASASVSNGPLVNEYFGLKLINSTVTPEELEAYYINRGTPEPYLSYLIAGANGTNPFAFINGTTLKLVDAAKYAVAGGADVDMTIPGDYPFGTYTVSGTIIDESGNETTVTYILKVEGDRTEPELNVSGFTANDELMAGDLATGYILDLVCSDAETDFLVQFASASVSNGPLANEYFELKLTGQNGVTVDELEAYYASKPEPWKTYLIEAANGTKPFAYINGNTVKLVDAARHDLAGGADVDMTIPGDYPFGTYTVSGTIKDVSGCLTPVSYILKVQGDRTTPTATITAVGEPSVCSGGSATLNMALTGTGPWNIVYTDGTTTESVTGITTNPYTFSVSPAANTTYTVINVTDANGCSNNATSSARIYVGPITTIGTIENACINSDIVVPVTVESFDEVGFIALTLNYEPTKLFFKGSVKNPLVTMANMAVIGNNTTGVIKIVGFINEDVPTDAAVSLIDGSELFNLTFTYLGGAANITFDDATDDAYCEYGFGDSPDFTPFCDNEMETVKYYINGTVTVDDIAPVITTCASNQNVNVNAGSCAGTVPDLTDEITASDNCTFTVSQSPAAGTTFGTAHGDQQVVTITVTDANNNTANCTATLTLVDDIAPVITACASNQNVNVNAGSCAGTVPDLTDEITASDNCTFTVSQSPAAGTTFGTAHGDQQVVTITVTDANNNTANCTATLTLVDNIAPTITCPTPAAYYYVNDNSCTWTGIELEPVIVENCTPTLSFSLDDGLTFEPGDANGYLFPVGATNVIYKVTDEAGNSVECPFTIIVKGVTLTGSVKYLSSLNTAMSNTTISLQQGGVERYSTETTTVGITTPAGDINGNYIFENICPGDYEVVFTTSKPVGGINSGDAAQVNAWSLAPYSIERVRFLAGDVTGPDGLDSQLRITSFDASKILDYFVYGSGFEKPWEFWKAGETVNSKTQPNTVLSIHVPSPSESTAITQDFYAMVSGDFNMSFKPDVTKAGIIGSESVTLLNGDIVSELPEESIDLPVNAVSSMQVGAISLIMKYPVDQIQIESVFLKNNPDQPVQFNAANGELRIGWYSINPLSLAADETMLTVRVKLASGQINNEELYFRLANDPLIELADGDCKVIPDAVLMMNGLTLKSDLSTGIDIPGQSAKMLMSCYPNPFSENAKIKYTLPENGRVSIEVTSILGNRVRLLSNQQQIAGEYMMDLDGTNIVPGVYQVTLRFTNNNGKELNRTIRMIKQ